MEVVRKAPLQDKSMQSILGFGYLVSSLGAGGESIRWLPLYTVSQCALYCAFCCGEHENYDREIMPYVIQIGIFVNRMITINQSLVIK